MVGRIVDVHGNPINTGKIKEPQSASVGMLRDQYAGHPSRGLTPAKLARILATAELGDITAQHDLFLDMEEKDGHIYAEMSKRKRALLTVDWDVVPPRNASSKEKKAAAYVKELLTDVPNFEDVILDALDAVGHGFACLEIEWQLLGREWLPKAITHRPQTWFQTDRATRSQIRLRDMTLDGAELQPFGWIAHVHRAKSGYLARAGLHRVLAWPYLFKNFSVRDLAEFLEIYGLPLRLGTYPSGTSDEEQNTLLRAVTQIGHDAAGIIPEGMIIDFKEAAKGSHDPFQAMMDWCERTQSKAILGGTLTSQADGKSSTNALGAIHNEVRHDLLMSDAMQLAYTFTRDLLYPLQALNVGSVDDIRRISRLVFDVREPEDLQLLSEALPRLADAGVQIPVSWVAERLRIPQPAEGEAVMERSRPAEPPMVEATARLAAATRIVAAANRAVQAVEEDELEDLADELAGDWERVSSPLIQPLLDAAAEAGDYESFLARLPELIQDMDADALAQLLAQGQFAARIWGRISGGQP